MKSKLKSKLSDAIFTFIGSILALFISSKYTTNIEKFLKELSISDSNIDRIVSFIFALLVVISFIVSMLIWEAIKHLCAFRLRPKIFISYTNEKNKTLENLSFRKNPEDPQFLSINFTSKFNLLQLTLLKKMQCRLKIEINPKIFSIELNDGFESDDQSEITDNILYFKIFDLYSPSKNEMQIIKNIQLQRISSGIGEIKYSMEIKGSKLKWFLYKYCIFDVKNLQIEG